MNSKQQVNFIEQKETVMNLQVQKAVYNLITTILVMGGFVFYMFVIQGDANLPRIEEPQFWGGFMLKMIGFTIVAKIILFIIFAIVNKARNENADDMDFMDERDKLIEMKSDRNGNYFFILGLMCSMIPLAMGYPIQYMFIILISGGFIAGILGDVWKIYYYNKGI